MQLAAAIDVVSVVVVVVVVVLRDDAPFPEPPLGGALRRPGDVVVEVVVVVVEGLLSVVSSVHMLTTFSVLGSFFSFTSSLNLLSLP